METIGSLPDNFITHELLDLDVTDIAEFEDFSREYGLLFAPQRFNPVQPFRVPTASYRPGTVLDDSKLVCPWGGYDESSGAMARAMDDTNKLAYPGVQNPPFGGRLPGRCVSLEEARITAWMLASAVGMLVAAQATPGEIGGVRGWHLEDAVSVLNAGATRTTLLVATDGGGYPSVPTYCLTNAICDQALRMASTEGYSWKKCPVCGHWYKSQRHDKTEPLTLKRSPNEPRTCSDTCSRRAKERRKRENRKRRKERANEPNPAE